MRHRGWSSGVPLGGIGAGKIEFSPDGTFRNVTASNNMDAPISDCYARTDWAVSPGGMPSAFLAYHEEGRGGWVLKDSDPGGMRAAGPSHIRFRGRFPLAQVSYPRLGRLRLSLTAFSSFRLDEPERSGYRDSSVPAAGFVFRLRNPGRRPVRAALSFSWPNLVGQGGFSGCPVNDMRGQTCRFHSSGGNSGLVFSSRNKELVSRVRGEYALIIGGAPGLRVTAAPGWKPGQWGMEGEELWRRFSERGELHAVENGGEGAGWISAALTVPPGAEREVAFSLSWWFPRLTAARSRVEYGHAYERWWKGAWDAGAWFLRERKRLLGGVRAWQGALDRSTLPPWLAGKLCDNLFPMYANTWYARDGRFTVAESPTCMEGCLGTIDQRNASSIFTSMSFPGLDRSELELFARGQVDKGNPERFAPYWSLRTGRLGGRLDRAGAIRHDTGWDDLEGGKLGNPLWLTAHWPDLAPAFVLQIWRLAAWSGDLALVRRLYPRVRAALEFQQRLDQDGDSIPDLFGRSSSTFDSHCNYGASPYIATLTIAALEAASRMAALAGCVTEARAHLERAGKVRAALERVLWDSRKGYYLTWRDKLWRNSRRGPRPHGERSRASMLYQLAGQWFPDHLGLPSVVPPRRARAVLRLLARRHLTKHKLCPPVEAGPAGSYEFAWLPYAESYFAFPAISAGLVREGLEVLRRHDRAVEQAGKRWDTNLVFQGKRNDDPGWGWYYMSYPASWGVLPALAGIALDLLGGFLRVAPSRGVPSRGGRSCIPVFFPSFWGEVTDRRRGRRRETTLRITRWLGDRPLRFRKLETVAAKRVVRLVLNGRRMDFPSTVGDPSTGRLSVFVEWTAGKAGDALTFLTEED